MAERRAFQFCSGTRCLDLVDTLANRSGDTIDLLETPAALDHWIAAADFALELPPATSADLDDVRRLRAAILALILAAMGGTEDAAAQALVNEFALRPAPRPQLVGGALCYVAENGAAAVIAALAEDALVHLGANRRKRLRQCEECNMLFYDNSPPGKRRWCSSSAGCGNRAKVRRHRARARPKSA